MAKNRFGKKKSKSGHRKSATRENHRATKPAAAAGKTSAVKRFGVTRPKNAKHVAAGRASWRAKVKRWGSKKAAILHTFGARVVGAERLFGTGKKAKKNHRKHAGNGNGNGNGNGKSLFKAALLEVQTRNGTKDWPPTAAEVRDAEQIAHHERTAPRGHDLATDDEQRLRDQFAAQKKALIKKRAAEKLRKMKKAEHEAETAVAEAAAEAELRDL